MVDVLETVMDKKFDIGGVFMDFVDGNGAVLVERTMRDFIGKEAIGEEG
jgi:hypothetical protein